MASAAHALAPGPPAPGRPRSCRSSRNCRVAAQQQRNQRSGEGRTELLASVLRDEKGLGLVGTALLVKGFGAAGQVCAAVQRRPHGRAAERGARV